MSEAISSVGILSTDHTGFTVRDLHATTRFFVETLGFTVIHEEHFPQSEFLDNVVGVSGAEMSLAMLESPHHKIELLEYSAPESRQEFTPRSCDVGSVHIAFYVTDIDSLVLRCVQASWMQQGRIQTIDSGPRAGFRLAYIRSTDGITLEFLQRPEAKDKE